MLVDIGGGTTEVAVISMGGIVASNSLRVAGDELDEAIIASLRKTRGLLIGPATAELLKTKIGSAHREIDRGSLVVSGMNRQRRTCEMAEISSAEVREALSESLDQIIFVIQQTLEQTPPELSSDLYDFGIVLTGGGALLPGLARLIGERTGVRVQIAKRPLESVCAGLLRAMSVSEENDGFFTYRER